MTDATELQPDPTPHDAEPAAAARSTLPVWAPWVIAGLAGIVVGSVGTIGLGAAVSGVGSFAGDQRFADAVKACGGENEGMYLEDEGQTLVLDVEGEEEASGASYDDYACLFAELKAPGRVESHVGQTTSMDGRQVEDWDGIQFSWSYHPDRGLDGVFEYVDRD